MAGKHSEALLKLIDGGIRSHALKRPRLQSQPDGADRQRVAGKVVRRSLQACPIICCNGSSHCTAYAGRAIKEGGKPSLAGGGHIAEQFLISALVEQLVWQDLRLENDKHGTLLMARKRPVSRV